MDEGRGVSNKYMVGLRGEKMSCSCNEGEHCRLETLRGKLQVEGNGTMAVLREGCEREPQKR